MSLRKTPVFTGGYPYRNRQRFRRPCDPAISSERLRAPDQGMRPSMGGIAGLDNADKRIHAAEIRTGALDDSGPRHAFRRKATGG